MDTPLYKLYLFRRTAKYFETSPQEMAAMRGRMAERQRALGIRNLFNAEMAWSNEKYEYFGVEFYPSLEVLQAFTHCLSEVGFYQYVQGDSFLGIPMDNSFPEFSFPSPPAIDCEAVGAPGADARDSLDFGYGKAAEAPPLPVYRVYFSRPAASALLVPAEERAEILLHTEEAGKMLGVQPLLSAYMRWNHEPWEYFGIERFQDMETVIGYTQYLNEAGWYRITDSLSYLGTAYGGLAAE